MRVVYVVLTFLVFSQVVKGQTGGRSVFQILDLAPSARTLALGGKMISVQDSDVVLAQLNPSIAKSYSTHQIAFNQSFYYTGSSYSTLSGTYHLSKQNITLIGGLQSLRHGDIQGADEYGNKTNSFSSSENLISLGASKKLFDPLFIGINLKLVFSNIESYQSSGLGIDLGAFYKLKENKSLGLTVNNIGTQWSPYQNLKENLPFDIRVGYTQRLEHVPFQFSLTVHHLQKWNLRSIDEESTINVLGEPLPGPSAFSKDLDNIFRHFILNTEIFLGKNAPLRLRLSYNHQRHQELKDQSYRGFSGFGGGVGIQMSKLVIDYGLANYHLAGSVHAIGIAYRW